jgi:omega-3 fatty acid desaturase (delta-15 desaturase)
MDLIANIRRAIPAHCFTPSYTWSLFYMLRDVTLFASAVWVYPNWVHDSSWITHLLYWNIYGFLGWCVFVIGHDCGHNSFSKSRILNGVCGHICHAILLVPFYPWARSHHQHHSYHNHKIKDRSYPWMTKAQLDAYSWFVRQIITSIINPFVGFWVYLYYGIEPEGSHMIWFGQLYADASSFEKIKAGISIVTVALWLNISLLILCQASLTLWLLAYGGVVAMTYFWLFVVTWFQHHDEQTYVYDHDTWTFTKGALQTVDRHVGYGIDDLHHHITDGHVVHHLFFTSIPHYHLQEATRHMYAFGAQNNIPFKFVDHSAYFGKYVVDFIRLYPKINITHWLCGK